ncbi:MAG: hypothetical protein JSU64_05985 [candidate division WOR-3 bacterium]|nr:MAG: hypothetical protein JSU64_05985 [candidate division WOR-3 bacterium]
MSCRHCLWAIVVVFAGCASLLDRRSDFERGLQLFGNRQYSEAVEYFVAHHREFPDSDSTLYYLFNCYKHLNRQEDQTMVLEKMALRNIRDKNIYLNLVYLYREDGKYEALFNMLTRLQPAMTKEVDMSVTLTRRLLAELLCGAAGKTLQTDPMVFCISRGYLPLSPDGQLYEHDTLTTANLIVLLDRLVEPVYPRNLLQVQKIPTRSYLYLPYMRLVDQEVLEFDPHITPDRIASVITAVRALDRLDKRKRFD